MRTKKQRGPTLVPWGTPQECGKKEDVAHDLGVLSEEICVMTLFSPGTPSLRPYQIKLLAQVHEHRGRVTSKGLRKAVVVGGGTGSQILDPLTLDVCLRETIHPQVTYSLVTKWRMTNCRRGQYVVVVEVHGDVAMAKGW